MNYSKLIYYFLASIAIVIIGFAIKNKFSKKHANESLTIGMMSDWHPFMSINNKGQYEGFDIDIANEMEKNIGKKIIIKDLGSLSTLFIALERGEIDIVMSGLDISKERKKNYLMIPYFGDTIKTMGLVYNKSKSISKNDLKDKKLKVGVEPGHSINDGLCDLYKNLERDYISSLSDMILRLKYKKVDGLLMEPALANRIASENNDIFEVFEFDIPKEFWIDGCGIVLKNGNIKLGNIITKAINKLRTNGTIGALEKKWKVK
jgi:ABC-type amino acid transport substrate-binding protein